MLVLMAGWIIISAIIYLVLVRDHLSSPRRRTVIQDPTWLEELMGRLSELDQAADMAIQWGKEVQSARENNESDLEITRYKADTKHTPRRRRGAKKR